MKQKKKYYTNRIRTKSILFLILIISLLTQNVFSQKKEEINEAFKIYKQGKYELSELLFNNIKRDIEVNNLNDDSIKFICNFFLVQTELALGKDSLAEGIANEMQNLAKNKFLNHIFYINSLSTSVIVFIKKKNIAKAEKYNEEVIELLKNKFGTNNIDYYTALVNKGVIWNLKGNYYYADSIYNQAAQSAIENKIGNVRFFSRLFNYIGKNKQDLKDIKGAEDIYETAMNFIEKIDGRSFDYFTIKNELALLFFKNNKYLKALELLNDITSGLYSGFGESSMFYIKALNTLSTVQDKLNDYKNSDSIFIKVLALQKKYYGENSEDYIIYLTNASNHFNLRGQFEKCLSYARGALALVTTNPTYSLSLFESCYTKMGDAFYSIDNIDSSQYYYKKALSIHDRYKETNQADLAILLSKIARVSKNNLQSKEIEQLYLKSLNILKTSVGESHPYYSAILSDLGNYYFDIGLYAKAEFYLKSSLSVYQENSNQKSLDYVIVLTSLTQVNIVTGNYKNAEKILLEALSIQKEINGIEHPQYGTMLSILGSFYKKIGNYEKSETYFKEALDVSKSLLNDNHRDYIACLNNLGNLYKITKLYKLSEKYLSEAINLSKSGNYNELTKSYSILNLAGVFSDELKYKEANTLYIEALGLQKKLLPESHPSLAITLFNMAMNCEKLNEIKKAIYYYEQAIKIANENLNLFSIDFTTNRIQEFQNQSKDRYYILSSLLNKGYNVAGMIYNNELQNKSFSLNRFSQVLKSIIQSNDTLLYHILDSFQNVKNRLSFLYSQINNKYSDETSMLERESERLELELVQGSQTYRSLKKQANADWKTIQSKLKSNEASIEFLSYNFYSNKWTDSIYYGALILRPGFKEPKFVYLFEQKKLESKIQKRPNDHDSLYLSQLYRYEYNGKKLQELIWKPMDSLLDGVKTIYVAPSGLLHTINLSALPLANNIRICDKYNLRIVGSTNEITTHQEQYISDSSVNKAWLFGGIDYDNISFTQSKFIAGNEINYYLSSNPNTRTGTEKWIYLLNTLYEVSSIDTLCRNNNITTTFINGKLASKTVLKNISGETKPYILHLATHGYFFPDIKKKPDDLSYIPLNNKQNIIKASDNPLLRSGLIFSGANKTWSNPNYQSDSTDDGILTALEVSNLDLSEAKLVVMSACETGLGDIKGSEGVFGLQRAFKLAGAKNIIMSLWKVPDAQTKELMKLFYQKCFDGLCISDALKMAQTEMSKKYPPYYWAAFKLLE